MRSRLLVAAGAATLLLAAGCGSARTAGQTVTVTRPAAAPAPAPTQTVAPIPTKKGQTFSAESIYSRVAPGVVTVISLSQGGGTSLLGGGSSGPQEALGSGFVVSKDGEIVTNDHVVSTGKDGDLHRAAHVFVKFRDGNEVSAKIVGTDPNADVALLRVDPKGLTLRPLSLGSSSNLVVGAPVAAIGSPFGEPQSLSVGVISALHRFINSLNNSAGQSMKSGGLFQITNAIQTDAAINHGNSGGPLVDASGQVIGINSQIQTSNGGGEGVGFAVPIDAVKHSISQLRAKGHVDYGYLGVATVVMYPQLAQRAGFPVGYGAWVQQVTPGSPAAKAGLRGGNKSKTLHFQDRQGSHPYLLGGDLITAVNGTKLRHESDLSQQIAPLAPGTKVHMTVYRGKHKRTITVTLGKRPTA
jgi:S1-C subfamily serine protease